MLTPVCSTYLENEVLHADPLKLVCILYRAALDSVAAARVKLREKNIRERSRCISRAEDIVNQLILSLDRRHGGEVGRNLTELYVYIQSRLLDANVRQVDAPLAEVERLMGTLLEAWTEAEQAPRRAPVLPAVENELAPVACTC